MGDFTPIIVAVITTHGVVLAAALGAGAIGRKRSGSTSSAAAKWREQAELEKARADLAIEQRDVERAGRLTALEQRDVERSGRLTVVDQLAATRHDLDDCVRQRDDAFSDLRSMKNRRGAAS